MLRRQAGFAGAQGLVGLHRGEHGLELEQGDALFAHAGTKIVLDKEEFGAAMTVLALLRGPVDAFFDKVKVNADEPAVRQNRLRLLSQIRATLGEVADFSKIEG